MSQALTEFVESVRFMPLKERVRVFEREIDDLNVVLEPEVAVCLGSRSFLVATIHVSIDANATGEWSKLFRAARAFDAYATRCHSALVARVNRRAMEMKDVLVDELRVKGYGLLFLSKPVALVFAQSERRVSDALNYVLRREREGRARTHLGIYTVRP